MHFCSSNKGSERATTSDSVYFAATAVLVPFPPRLRVATRPTTTDRSTDFVPNDTHPFRGKPGVKIIGVASRRSSAVGRSSLNQNGRRFCFSSSRLRRVFADRADDLPRQRRSLTFVCGIAVHAPRKIKFVDTFLFRGPQCDLYRLVR